MNDNAFATALRWVRVRGLCARTDIKGNTEFFKRPKRRHHKLICTQPSRCDTSPSAFCKTCALAVYKVT